MNSKEIINELLRKEKAVRVVLYGNGQMKRGIICKKNENNKMVPIDPMDHFGFDMYIVGGMFDNLPIRGFSEVIDETNEWIAKRNGAGAVLKYWKYKSGAPEYIDF